MQLNPVQLTAAGAYDTDTLALPDLTKPFPSRALATCGDGLFNFIISELSDVGDDYDEALRRMTTARLQLQDVERALFARKPASEEPTQP